MSEAEMRMAGLLATALEAAGRKTMAQIVRDHGGCAADQFDAPTVIRAMLAAEAAAIEKVAALIEERARPCNHGERVFVKEYSRNLVTAIRSLKEGASHEK